MLFWKKKKNKIYLREALTIKYKSYFFLKSVWKKIFEAEILVIESPEFEKCLQKFEILPHVKILILKNLSIEKLPKLPQCTHLFTKNCKLQSLPDLPQCIFLQVTGNQLRELPLLPKCKFIFCSFNKLQKIDNISKCKKLFCNNNRIKYLPNYLPKCITLHICNNRIKNLPYLPKCKSLHISYNPIQQCVLNNICNTHSNFHLDISRFSKIQETFVHLLVSYHKWLERDFKLQSPFAKIIKRSRFMNDSTKNILFMKKFLQEHKSGLILFLSHFPDETVLFEKLETCLCITESN